MSDFVCEVVRIDAVEDHPNANRLKIVKIKGFNCISGNLDDGSPRYAAGDLVVYIPEGAVLGEPMLRATGFWDEALGKGQLAGPLGDRVKAVKLRGVVSQGILYPIVKLTDTQKRYYGTDTDGLLHLPNDMVEGYLKFYNVKVGDNVADKIHATKYIPVIPTCMNGEVTYIGRENTVSFDVENIQKYPDVFVEGEQVVITEKLHGTFCGFGYVPGLNSIELIGGVFFAFSKGLGSDGLVFKDNEANAGNLYQKTLKKYLHALNRAIIPMAPQLSVYVLGEIYGKGVQDLTYGTVEPQFRVFAIAIRDRATGGFAYLSEPTLAKTIRDVFERVPVLYRGPFSHAVVEQFRDGTTTAHEVAPRGHESGIHIREGVVITPVIEREDPVIGRVALKAVSPDYLFRKGNATEYN